MRISQLAEAAKARGRELAGFATSPRAALAHLAALPDRAERCDPECEFLTSPDRVAPADVEFAGRPADTARSHTAPIAYSPAT
jgi:MerR family transcriptional regulator, copper efflux regulator